MDMSDKITEITREIMAAGDSSECPRPVFSPMLWRDGSFPQKLRQTEQEMRGFFTNRAVIIEPFQDLGFDCLALFTQGNRALTTASKSLLYYLAWISGFSICFDVEHPMFFLSRYKKGSPLSHALDSKNPFIIAHILNMLKRFPPGYESMVQTQNLRQKLISLLASVTLQYPLFGNYLFLQYEQLLCYYQPSRSPSKIQVYQTAVTNLCQSSANDMDQVCALKRSSDGLFLFEYTTNTEVMECILNAEDDLPGSGKNFYA